MTRDKLSNLKLSVDAGELANAAAQLVCAYERMSLAIDALERATGIKFREQVSEEFNRPQEDAR